MLAAKTQARWSYVRLTRLLSENRASTSTAVAAQQAGSSFAATVTAMDPVTGTFERTRDESCHRRSARRSNAR